MSGCPELPLSPAVGSWWEEQLAGVDALDFPEHGKLTGIDTSAFGGQLASLGNLSLQLPGASRDSSAAETFITAWMLTLSRFCNQRDLAMCIAVNGIEGSEQPATLHAPIRADLGEVTSFCQARAEVVKQLREATARPLSLLQIPELSTSGLLGRACFAWSNSELAAEQLAREQIAALKPDLHLALWSKSAGSGKIQGALRFRRPFFDQVTAHRIWDILCRVALSAGSEKLPSLVSTPELHEADRHSVDDQWDYLGPLARHRTVPEALLDNCVVPSRSKEIAVRAPDGVLSWADLRWEALKVRSAICRYSVKEGSFVGVAIEPSTWTAVATLGVWLASCAYVPLDPGLPKERLSFIVANARISVVLTLSHFSTKVLDAAPSAKLGLLDMLEFSEDAMALPSAMPALSMPAYAIFTSGSTGNPKGVPISHAGLLSHVRFMVEVLGFTSIDVFLQAASFMFDAHILELWPTLYAGGQVVISKKDGGMDIDYLMQLLNTHGCSGAFFVPSVLQELVRGLEVPQTLKKLIVGGEATSLALCSTIMERLRPEKLANFYGPTEVSVASHVLGISSIDQVPADASATLPIGFPCAWRQQFILDQWLDISLSGVGELVLLGPGLANGCAYIDLPDVSARSFQKLPPPLTALPSVANSPQSRDSQRNPMMYRTGDLVRTLHSGALEFVGRIDHQVKIRGLRIELGEIEAVIRSTSGVEDTVVLVHDDRIIAYASGEFSEESLLKECAAHVPRYMVPSAVVHMPHWPRMPSGKINLKALPRAPASKRLAVARTMDEEPPSQLEQQLMEMICAILAIDGGISPSSSFFELGGSSLQAGQLLGAVRRDFGKDVKFADFYAKASARQLAALLGTEPKDQLPSMVPGHRQDRGVAPASHGQEQMMALFEMQPGSPSYSCPLLFHISGPFDVDVFVQSVLIITSRHDALRTNVDRSPHGQVQQYIYPPEEFELPAHMWKGGKLQRLTPINTLYRQRAASRGASFDQLSASRASSAGPRQWSAGSPRPRGSPLARSPRMSPRALSPRGRSSPRSRSPGLRSPAAPSPSGMRSPIGSQPRLATDSAGIDAELLFFSVDPASSDDSMRWDRGGRGNEYEGDWFAPCHRPVSSDIDGLRTWLLAEAEVPFDLAGEPLVRLVVAEADNGDHLVLLNTHHACFDGASVRVLGAELKALYIGEGQLATPPKDLPAQYVDYTRWHNSLPATAEYARQITFWREQLADVPRMQLPTDFPRPSVLTDEASTVPVHLDDVTVAKLRSLASGAGCTLYTVLYALYALILGRLCSTSDVLVGTAWHGREAASTDELIGFFVNTVMLRMAFEWSSSFSDLLRLANATVLGAFENASVDYNSVLAALECPSSPVVADFAFADVAWSRARLSDHFSLNGLNVRVEDVTPVRAKFELLLQLEEDGVGGVRGHFEYNTNLFSHQRMEATALQLTTLARNVATRPDGELCELDILPAPELARVEAWQQAVWPEFKGANTLVADMFLDAARRHPSACALLLGKNTMTYSELHRHASCMASRMQSDMGIGRERVVALVLERSFEYVIAQWAVILAGGAYVPVDPEYPVDRVQSILEDVEPLVVVVRRARMEQIRVANSTVLAAEDIWAREGEPAKAMGAQVQDRDLAYIVFSSGSTGKPKGSAVEHGMLANEIHCNGTFMKLQPGDKVFQFHNPAFDGAVPELVGVLCHGATLVLWESGENFVDAIHISRTTKVTMTPSGLSVLDPTTLWLDSLAVGAEALPLQLANTWAGRTHMWNFYGPSECTVDATASRVLPNSRAVHIGRPIPNVCAYILQGSSRQPMGVPGELCIGGVQVARGYVRRPELTREKFVEDPFVSGGRMYRTGDLAAWTQEGNIKFIGRLDFQVKIRGFRVEPGEVEVGLQELGCSTSLVLVEEGQLVAFVTPVQDVSELRKRLAARLPPYFVPSRILSLAELPRTANGKFNRDALRKLSREKPAEAEEDFVTPRSPMEQTLVDLTKEVLDIPELSITASLRLAGMTSLKAMRLVVRLRGAGFEVSLTDLYNATSIEELVDSLETLQDLRCADDLARAVAGDVYHQKCTWAQNCLLGVKRVIATLLSAMFHLLAWLWIGAVMIYPSILPALLAKHVSELVSSEGSLAGVAIFLVLTAIVGWPLYNMLLMLGVIFSKWIIIGRYREGKYAVGSFMYLRWWAFDRLFSYANGYCLSSLRGGRQYLMFLRALGLNVAGPVYISSASVSEFDLIHLSSGVCMLEGARLRAAVIEDGWLYLKATRVGNAAMLREGAVAMPGSVIPDNLTLAPLACVSGRDELQVGQSNIWWGNPARPMPRQNTSWSALPVTRQLSPISADLLGLMASGVALVVASASVWPLLALGIQLMRKDLSGWPWWEQASGFQLGAVAMVFGQVVLPYCDLVLGDDSMVRASLILDEDFQADFAPGGIVGWLLLALIAVTVLTLFVITLGLFVVLLRKLLRACRAGRAALVLTRMGFVRCFGLFNGTWACAMWLKLMGASVSLSASVTLRDFPEHPESLVVGSHSILMNPVIITRVGESRVRETRKIIIGKGCMVEGALLLTGADIADDCVVQGTCLASPLTTGLSMVGLPPVYGRRVVFKETCEAFSIFHRCAVKFCHLLFPLVSMGLANFVLIAALLALDLFVTHLQANWKIDAEHFGRGVAAMPIFYLLFGLSVAITSVPLKWVVGWRQFEAPLEGGFEKAWRPHFSLSYYRRLLAQWIHDLAALDFMSITMGSRFYNVWLRAHGAQVAQDALVFTALSDFDLVTVGSNAVVGRDVAVSGKRVLPCGAPNFFVETNTRVTIGLRSVLGEGAAVAGAETGELSVCTAMTGIGPDTSLPSRALAVGSVPWRYEWQRGSVKQLDPSPLSAPPLEQDLSLSTRFISELHKVQRQIRRRSDRLESALVTGAAGFLARFVVAQLLSQPEKPVVYCLVRGNDIPAARKRVLTAMEKAGIVLTSVQQDRLHVICGDLGKSRLGLDLPVFEDLCSNISHVFHIATRVNHAEPYHMLRRDNVTGTMNMLEFSATSRLKAFHYVSTIGTVTPDMSSRDGLLHESTPLGSIRMGNLFGSCEITGGYGYSKWVAEKLCFSAFNMGLPGTIWRPGLIGGCSATGFCGEDNFVELLCDMVHLGRAPRMVGNQFNLTPVDFIAHAMVDAARRPSAEWRGKAMHPVAADSDLDMPTIVSTLAAAGHPLNLADFRSFRQEIKTKFAESLQASEAATAGRVRFKSWLLVGALAAEGHGADALSSNAQARRYLQRAPGAQGWTVESLLAKMVDHLIAVGRMPAPSSIQIPLATQRAPRGDSAVPLLSSDLALETRS